MPRSLQMRRQAARLKFKAGHEAVWNNLNSPMVEVPRDVWGIFEYSCDQNEDEYEENGQGNDLQQSSINGICMKGFYFHCSVCRAIFRNWPLRYTVAGSYVLRL